MGRYAASLAVLALLRLAAACLCRCSCDMCSGHAQMIQPVMSLPWGGKACVPPVTSLVRGLSLFEHSSDYGVVWPVPRGPRHGHGERPLKSVHAVLPSLLVIPSLPTGPIIVFRSSQPAASLVHLANFVCEPAPHRHRCVHASSVMFSSMHW